MCMHIAQILEKLYALQNLKVPVTLITFNILFDIADEYSLYYVLALNVLLNVFIQILNCLCVLKRGQ